MKPSKYFFNLESRANKSNKHLIYFNLNYGYKIYNPATEKYHYQNLRISTEYSIKKEYWIQIKKTKSQDGEPIYKANKAFVSKFGKDLNVDLEKIKNLCINQLKLFRNEYEINPKPKELKRIVLEKLGRIEKVNNDVLITKYIDKIIAERKKLPPTSIKYWGDGTIKQYKNLKSHIENHQTRTSTQLTFSKLNETEYWNIFDSINKRNQESEGNSIKHNTIAKICKHLRVILKSAVENNIEIGFKWNNTDFKIKEVTTENNTALEQEQLLKIYNTDTDHSREFYNARNYILFSSLTALRIGDMVELHTCKVETYKVKNKTFKGFLTKIRKSNDNTTELFTIIPLAKSLLEIIEQNNGNFPKFPSKPVIGRQIKKFLKFLEYDEIVEFKERYYPEPDYRIETHKQHVVFSPHSCRYTFITNMSKLEIPESVVKNITHPTIKARSVLDGYNLSNMQDNAYKLSKYLKNQKSKIYSY
ncbi:MAG: hypothetical protein COB12_13380 [Flavobacterium sp.]|nr:MAG: hypothetical protein COB12_13380 [Flavobacterium sp.]